MSQNDIADLNGGRPVRTDEENTGGRDFDPLPAGWYPVECQKAELKDTRDKKGKYLWLQCVVIGEHYKGRTVFPLFNLANPSAKAVEIGQRDLGFLGQSAGLPTGVKSSVELIGKQFDVRLTIKKAVGDYPADNKVSAYERLGKMSSQAPAAPKANGAAAKKGQGMAWDKKPEATPPPASAPPAAAAPPEPAATTVAPAVPTAPAAASPTPSPTVAAGATPGKALRPWERK